jgi:hypothetical protein
MDLFRRGTQSAGRQRLSTQERIPESACQKRPFGQRDVVAGCKTSRPDIFCMGNLPSAGLRPYALKACCCHPYRSFDHEIKPSNPSDIARTSRLGNFHNNDSNC